MTPKLRFKEFSEEWESFKIGDISSCIVPGRNKPKRFDGSIPWITTVDLHGKVYISNSQNNLCISTEEANHIGSKIVPKNSILMSCVGDLGIFAIANNEIIINQQLHAFLIDNSKYNSLFLMYALFIQKKYIYQTATKTAVPYLNKNNCNAIPINIPTFKEQIKIAEFFTLIDKKIDQLQQKYDLLNDYKKGLLQQIFSQKLRFKKDDGTDFADWEEKRLCEISEHFGGTALEKFVSNDAKYNFISIGNYSINGKYIDNGQRILLNEKTKLRLLKKNDLVMVLNDKTATGDLIGSTILINSDNKFIFNQRSEKIVCSEKVIPLYLWQFLNSFAFRSEVRKQAQGGTQIYVKFSSVNNISFKLPQLEEQTKIANFLTAIDDKITNTKQQLKQTQQWKKGLLQQMFV